MEGTSMSEDDDDDVELWKNDKMSSRSRNKLPSHGRGALIDSDDDGIEFGLDDDLPVHPKWKSSHVDDFRQGARSPRGGRSREREILTLMKMLSFHLVVTMMKASEEQEGGIAGIIEYTVFNQERMIEDMVGRIVEAKHKQDGLTGNQVDMITNMVTDQTVGVGVVEEGLAGSGDNFENLIISQVNMIADQTMVMTLVRTGVAEEGALASNGDSLESLIIGQRMNISRRKNRGSR